MRLRCEGMEKAYTEMASSTQNMQKLLSQKDEELGKLMSERKAPYSDRYTDKTSNRYENTLSNGNRGGDSEMWKLRCKYLTEKYFNMLKDMKHELKTLKHQSKAEIRQVQREMSEQFLKNIQRHLSQKQFSDLSRNISEPKIFSFNDEKYQDQSMSVKSPVRSEQNALPSKIVSELESAKIFDVRHS